MAHYFRAAERRSAVQAWRWLGPLQVSTPELSEVFSINAMAPFIINARLKPLLERSPAVRGGDA